MMYDIIIFIVSPLEKDEQTLEQTFSKNYTVGTIFDNQRLSCPETAWWTKG